MNFKTIAAAAFLSIASAASAIAAPVNVDFSFGGVSGTFFGLDDADGRSSATGFELFGLSTNYTYDGSAATVVNDFRFQSGVLQKFNFRLRSGAVAANSNFVLTDLFVNFQASKTLQSRSTELMRTPRSIRNTQSVTSVSVSPVSAVPLPAGGLLILSGFAGFVALRRRKTHIA